MYVCICPLAAGWLLAGRFCAEDNAEDPRKIKIPFSADREASPMWSCWLWSVLVVGSAQQQEKGGQEEQGEQGRP